MIHDGGGGDGLNDGEFPLSCVCMCVTMAVQVELAI